MLRLVEREGMAHKSPSLHLNGAFGVDGIIQWAGLEWPMLLVFLISDCIFKIFKPQLQSTTQDCVSLFNFFKVVLCSFQSSPNKDERETYLWISIN